TGELRAGVRLARDPSARAACQRRSNAIREAYEPLRVDELVGEHYGEILALARSAGTRSTIGRPPLPDGLASRFPRGGELRTPARAPARRLSGPGVPDSAGQVRSAILPTRTHARRRSSVGRAVHS